MKKINKYIPLSVLALTVGLGSCENGDIEYDDYEGGVSVYFPYQTPIRTLVMGEDNYNTDLDNAHKCKISATMGGAYKGRDIKVEIEKDESILNNVYRNGKKIEAMPDDYYSLSSTTMDFGGNMYGSVEVSFSDAFFDDDKAVTGGYVIPLVIKSQTGADRILTGEYDTEFYTSGAPQRTNSDAWSKQPMDYTLFCVKYINRYTGNFIRRITNFNGKDSICMASLPELPDYPVAVGSFRYNQGNDSIRKYYIPLAKQPIVATSTVNLNKVKYSAAIEDKDAGIKKSYEMMLDFAAGTISAPDGAAYTVSGSCAYREHGEKKAWGDKDRDALDIDYTITDGANTVSVKETLVAQSRGVKLETFETSYVESGE